MQDKYIKLSINLLGVYVKSYEEYDGILFIRMALIEQSIKCPKCYSIADKLHDKIHL